jgi:hypothetical protein
MERRPAGGRLRRGEQGGHATPAAGIAEDLEVGEGDGVQAHGTLRLRSYDLPLQRSSIGRYAFDGPTSSR